MGKINFIVLTLLLLFILAACGQGANLNKENQDPTLGSEPEIEEQEENTEETEIVTEEPTEPATEMAVLDTIYLYYSDIDLMDIYRVEIQSPYTKDEEGIQRALQRWTQGPEQEGLQSLVPEGVIVQSVEDRNGVAYISFSKELLAANLGSSGEAMVATQIIMAVEQFGYDEILVLINGEVIDSLGGHIDWSEPFLKTTSPEDFQLYNE
jgi:spore germination protein GerM